MRKACIVYQKAIQVKNLLFEKKEQILRKGVDSQKKECYTDGRKNFMKI